MVTVLAAIYGNVADHLKIELHYIYGYVIHIICTCDTDIPTEPLPNHTYIIHANPFTRYSLSRFRTLNNHDSCFLFHSLVINL